MRKFSAVALLLILLLSPSVFAQQTKTKDGKPAMGNPRTIDTRIDNMGYWNEMARLGLVQVAPDVPVEKSTFTGSKIMARGVTSEDSPDVPLTTENSTQSENSVFADPSDKNHVLNSNNSTENPVGNLYGANDFYLSLIHI